MKTEFVVKISDGFVEYQYDYQGCRNTGASIHGVARSVDDYLDSHCMKGNRMPDPEFDTSPVEVVESADPNDFTKRCSSLMRKGYKMHSSNCGFVNSEEYSFCSSYQAIFVKE